MIGAATKMSVTLAVSMMLLVTAPTWGTAQTLPFSLEGVDVSQLPTGCRHVLTNMQTLVISGQMKAPSAVELKAFEKDCPDWSAQVASCMTQAKTVTAFQGCKGTQAASAASDAMGERRAGQCKAALDNARKHAKGHKAKIELPHNDEFEFMDACAQWSAHGVRCVASAKSGLVLEKCAALISGDRAKIGKVNKKLPKDNSASARDCDAAFRAVVKVSHKAGSRPSSKEERGFLKECSGWTDDVAHCVSKITHKDGIAQCLAPAVAPATKPAAAPAAKPAAAPAPAKK